MSKTIILGTLTASAAFAMLPLTAATAQPPASVKTALWGRPPGRWCQSPRSRDRRRGTAMNATTGTTGRAATPAGNGGQTAPPTLPRQMMQAIVQAGYGSADVLL
jgi:hypothetical protein